MKSRIGILLNRNAELIRHRLQEHPVTGGALIGQLEIANVPVLEEENLDILTADIADHIDVAELVNGAHHMRDRLHDINVCPQRFFQHVCGVSRSAEADDLQLGPCPISVSRIRFSISFVSSSGLPLDS